MSENQEKMLVTQARGLWTASYAAGRFPENTMYRQFADHGFHFLTEKFWDEIDGGFFLFDPGETPEIQSSGYKLIYGNAFAIYALSEYGETEIVDRRKTWWAQAEALHSLALFHEIFPDEEKYKTAYLSMWEYIKNELIDPEFGGWYNHGLDSNPETIKLRKAHQWKSAYHNGRALGQILSY